MAQLDDALDSFHADLARAGELLEFVDLFRNFAASATDRDLERDAEDWSAAASLAQIAPGIRTDLPVLSGSLLLYLCGRFEFFVREILLALADQAVSDAATYRDLPNTMRNNIYELTLDVARRPARYGYEKTDGERLILSLSKNLDQSYEGALTVESRVLTITESNMRADVLADVFKRVGIMNIWAEVGKQAPLKALLGAGEDGACRMACTTRLDEIMRDRNDLAHPTGTVTFPGPDKVVDVCNFLRVLSQALVDIVRIPWCS